MFSNFDCININPNALLTIQSQCSAFPLSETSHGLRLLLPPHPGAAVVLLGPCHCCCIDEQPGYVALCCHLLGPKEK